MKLRSGAGAGARSPEQIIFQRSRNWIPKKYVCWGRSRNQLAPALWSPSSPALFRTSPHIFTPPPLLLRNNRSRSHREFSPKPERKSIMRISTTAEIGAKFRIASEPEFTQVTAAVRGPPKGRRLLDHSYGIIWEQRPKTPFCNQYNNKNSNNFGHPNGKYGSLNETSLQWGQKMGLSFWADCLFYLKDFFT